MAEAALVIGLATSVTTLAGACTKVLARLREFQSNARGTHGTFRDITIQLPLIVDIVSQIREGCDDGSLTADVQEKLAPVVEGCRRQVDVLDELVEKMLPATADSPARRGRKAIAALRKEKEVTKVKIALEEYKSTLTLYIAVATQKRQAAMIHEDLKHRCQVWLKPLPNVRDFHERRLQTKLYGTCDWIWEDPTFIGWDKQPPLSVSARLLCIYGTHGCGKTVLASSIIEGLKTRQLQTIFFYFSGTDPNLQSLGDLARTLLWQLLEVTNDKRSLEIVSKVALNGPPAHSELLDALTSVAALAVGPVYCVIDGVDESSALTGELLQQVLQILESQKNIRVILLGRKHVFQATTIKTTRTIEINSDLIRRDISALINSEIDAAIDVDLLRVPGLRDSIVETLQEKSDGMLLWVKLMVDDLRKAASQFELKKTLHNLPRGLQEAYRRTFLRLVRTLSDSELVRARKMLAFATVSCRALKLEEIRYVYALDSGPCTVLEEHLLTPPVQRILDVCGNFVNIKNDLVQLIHFSVKEFLTRPEDEWLRSGDEKIIDFRVDLPASHLKLGLICFDYLQWTEYGYPLRDSGGTEDPFLELGIKYPFLTYASRYMVRHFSWSGTPCADTLDKLRGFLRSERCLSWAEYLVMLSLEDRYGNRLPDDLEKFISWLGAGESGGEVFESEFQELTKRIREFGEHDPRVGQWRLFLDILGVTPRNASTDVNGVGDTTSLPVVRGEDFNPIFILNALKSNSPLPLHRQVNMFLRLQSYLQRTKSLTSALKMLFRIILQKAPTIPVYVLLAIGGFYARLDKLEEALEVYHAALAKVEGQETLVKFAILRGIGYVFYCQGKYEAAEQTIRRALEGREKVLGRENQYMLSTVVALGDVLYCQGKYEAAERMYRRAQEGREKVLGKGHLDTLSTVDSVGHMLGWQGKYEEAEQMFRRALEGREKVPGREDQDTLSTVVSLGDALYCQCKHEAAEQIYRRALEGREKVLGRENQYTLGTVADLGMALYYQGKYEAAEQMFRRALEGREKVLGKDHPDTMACLQRAQLSRQARGVGGDGDVPPGAGAS